MRTMRDVSGGHEHRWEPVLNGKEEEIGYFCTACHEAWSIEHKKLMESVAFECQWCDAKVTNMQQTGAYSESRMRRKYCSEQCAEEAGALRRRKRANGMK